MRSLIRIVCVLVVLGWLGHGTALARTRVAVLPFETLGTESKTTQKTQALVAGAIAVVPDHEVVSGSDVRAMLKKKPEFRACDGQAPCLARLGKELGVTYVVFGEVGGLGAAEVVYLELIDVAREQEIRSTTLELGDKDDKGAALAAVYRLLAPDQYMGTLAAKVDVEGASIYIDGKRVARSPSAPLPLVVGTHAVRITHPEFRDFVRFVDIEFQKTVEVAANLQAFPIVATDLQADPNARKPVGGYQGQESRPWYRSWYTAAGVGAAAFIGGAILVGILAGGIDADREEVVDPPM